MTGFRIGLLRGASASGAVFTTNFGGYTTGAPPSDWSMLGGGSGHTFTILASGGLAGGKVLRIAGGSGAPPYAVWDDIPGAENFEALFQTRITGFDVNGRRGGFAGRLNLATGIDIIEASIRRVTSTSQGNFLAGFLDSASIGGATDTDAYTPSTWVYVRVLAVGNDLKMRRWGSGATEPVTWDIEATMTASLPAGLFGFTTNLLASQSDYLDCRYLSVGINGASPILA